MKIYLTAFLALLAFNSFSQSQEVFYLHDINGNRVERWADLSQLEDDTEILETAEIADRNTQEDTHEIIASSLIPTKPIAQQKFGATQMTWRL